MTDGFSCQDITFGSEGDTLAGHLYLPEGRTDPLPAVVVTGSWLTVKEQMAGRYAAQLAEAGFAALAFDFAGWGASEGVPRDVESPSRKSRDIHHAVGFLSGHPAVAPDRVGALGICASAGYQAVNAVRDIRVRSLAMVAPWFHDADVVELFYGKRGVMDRIEAGGKALARYELTDEVEYVTAVSATDPSAAMYGEGDTYAYYLRADRGAIPLWPNRHAVQAWPEWLTYDAIPVARRLTAPVLLVHSEDGAIPDGARRFHQELAGPKEIVWQDGTQFDFYDQEDTVSAALSHVVRHFTTTLG